LVAQGSHCRCSLSRAVGWLAAGRHIVSMSPVGEVRTSSSPVGQTKLASYGIRSGRVQLEDLRRNREMQERHVFKLLTLQGDRAAKEIQGRIDAGLGVTAKGCYFEADVLKAALTRWAAQKKGTGTHQQDSRDEDVTGSPTACRSRGEVREAGANLKHPDACREESATPSRLKRKFSATVESASPRLSEDAKSPVRAVHEKLLETGREPEAFEPNPEPSPRCTRRQSAPTPPTSQSDPRTSRRLSAPPSISVPNSVKELQPPSSESDPQTLRRLSAPPSVPVSNSVKELKASLTAHNIDFSSCVEKADLQSLWDRFMDLVCKPLEELKVLCAQHGQAPSSVKECAQFLLKPSTAARSVAMRESSEVGASRSPAGSLGGSHVSCAPSDVKKSPEASVREQEAFREASRIVGLQKRAFHSTALWGFAVLCVVVHDAASVQKGYRSLMKRLHPDRVGDSPDGTRAVELLREAKDACERSLSRVEPPGMPSNLKSTPLCFSSGSRKFELRWCPPIPRPQAPVRKYVIAVFDPSYGRSLTVTVLEPDYSEELRRFIPVEELTSYILAEADLAKMPALWRQPNISVQVAAANEAGQSQWAKLQVPLSAACAQVQRPKVPPKHWSGWSFGSGSEDESDDPCSLDVECRRRHGENLRGWLELRKKADLVTQCRALGLSADGRKEQLIERIIAADSTGNC